MKACGGILFLRRTGDVIAECQQCIHKVDILGINVLRDRNFNICEVPKAANAERDKTVSQRLRHMLRDGQHCHVGMVLGHIVIQLIHGTDRYAIDFVTDQCGRNIKGGIQMEADLRKVKVLQ